MTYDVILSGGKTLEVTQDQRSKIVALLADKDSGSTSCLIGNNAIRISMIKAVLESKSQNLTPQKEKANQEMSIWNEMCLRMSRLHMKDKIDSELNIRILPYFRAIQLPEATIDSLRETMDVFYQSYPYYPRCPSVVWWNIVKPFATKEGLKWMELVIRNDNSINEWVQYQGYKKYGQ